MQVCEKLVKEYQETSQSDASKSYTVRLRTPDYPFPTCTCTAYAIKRNRNRKGLGGKGSMVAGDCKHVQRVLNTACTWIAPAGAPKLADNICPDCGGPLVELESVVVVDTSTKKAAVQMEGAPSKPTKKATVANLEGLVADLLRESKKEV